MQLINLVRQFKSAKFQISSRTILPSYQRTNGFNTTSSLSNRSPPESRTPEKPKRPMNSYVRYYQSIRATLQAKNPAASTLDLTKLAAAQWKLLDAKSKSKFVDEFKKEQAIWVQKNATYLSQLTDQQKNAIREARANKLAERIKQEHRKKLRELGRTKRPMTSFLFFYHDKRPTALTKEQNKALLKQMAQEWARMSDEDKAPYYSRSAQALAKYREAIDKWEKEMIAQDHAEVVRHKNAANIPIVTTKQSKK